MASGLSVWSANQVLDKLLRDTALTIPAGYWVALFTDPAAGTALRANSVGAAVEVLTSGTAYARVAVRAATGITWSVAASGSTNQNADIAFPQATASWNTVRAVALMDSATVGAGNVWMYHELSTPRAIAAPDVFRIPTNQFIITL